LFLAKEKKERFKACSLVGVDVGLGWLVLFFLEKNTVGWLV